MARKAIMIPLGLAACVLAADSKRRTEWLWKKDGTAQEQKNDVTINRTPKTTCSIQGTWYNQLGSETTINIEGDGILTGKYQTFVGHGGPSPRKLVGNSSTNGENDTFGMTVVWPEGRSVTSWTGQCHICDGEETLLTTWILTSKVKTCEDAWGANSVGQDMFKRYKFKIEDTPTPGGSERQNSIPFTAPTHNMEQNVHVHMPYKE